MKTLPMLSREWNCSLDGLRSFIRRRPTLRALGTKLGPARGYSPAEARKLKRAFEQRPTAAHVS